MAAPILNHNGEAIAAISIAGPTTRMTDERIRELIVPVRETVLAISGTLGFGVCQDSCR